MQIIEINHLKNEIEKILSDNKALEIKSINLKDKTSIADFMIMLAEILQDIYRHYQKY